MLEFRLNAIWKIQEYTCKCKNAKSGLKEIAENHGCKRSINGQKVERGKKRNENGGREAEKTEKRTEGGKGEDMLVNGCLRMR